MVRRPPLLTNIYPQPILSVEVANKKPLYRENLGPIQGMPNQWAIDATTFTLEGTRYLAYSGWPYGDTSDRKQALFIAPMEDASHLDLERLPNGKPVMISSPQYPWEFSDGDHGVNEGPQFLTSPDGLWMGLVFSCAGSWTNEYKLAVLHYSGGDPLSTTSWHKDPHPLLQSTPGGQGPGPFGPGHGSFTQVANGETVCVYHATNLPTEGWANRRARCQRVVFQPDGAGPYMGNYVGRNVDLSLIHI